jgi:hypothetical protein
MSDSTENVTIEISENNEQIDIPAEEAPTEEVAAEFPVEEPDEEPVEEVNEELEPEINVEESHDEPTEEVVAEVPVEEPAEEVAAVVSVEEPADEPTEEVAAQIIPKYVFIVPYRDREQQLVFFKKHMSFVLEDTNPNDYKIFYIHQQDNRSFNRGAMKNIGFLYVKSIYPNDYQNITLVFNDIDTMPYSKNFFNYSTNQGTIKHFYGFKYALGGIFSIIAGDFERLNGFPNFWAWGYEDNLMQKRALINGIFIDRTNFYPLMDKNVFQMKDGLERLVNRVEFDKYLGLTSEGISNIQNLTFNYDSDKNFVNITSFTTGTEDVQTQSVPFNITQGNRPFGNVFLSKRGRSRMSMFL